MSPPKTNSTRVQRQRLLRTLRTQSQRIGSGFFTRSQAPELCDLARAVDEVSPGKKSFVFRGVRFPLKFGFRRYVVDPDTGETLTGGGFLA